MISETPQLSARQVEFLVHSAAGKTTNEIAQSCFASIWTVQEYLDKARSELGAKNLQQAIVRAIALEILRLDQHGNVSAW